jgi:hypothetical protein
MQLTQRTSGFVAVERFVFAWLAIPSLAVVGVTMEMLGVSHVVSTATVAAALVIAYVRYDSRPRRRSALAETEVKSLTHRQAVEGPGSYAVLKSLRDLRKIVSEIDDSSTPDASSVAEKAAKFIHDTFEGLLHQHVSAVAIKYVVVPADRGVKDLLATAKIRRLRIWPRIDEESDTPVLASAPLASLFMEPNRRYFLENQVSAQRILPSHTPIRPESVLVVRISQNNTHLGFLWIASDTANAFDSDFAPLYAEAAADALGPVLETLMRPEESTAMSPKQQVGRVLRWNDRNSA